MTLPLALRVVALLAALGVYRAVRGPGSWSYSFRGAGTHAAVASVALACVVVPAAPLALATGLVEWTPAVPPAPDLLVLAGSVLLLTALPGEIVFRGLLFAGLQERSHGRGGPWPALALSSVIFSICHLPLSADPVFLLLVAWMGVACGWCYLRTGSLAPGVMVHSAVILIHFLMLREIAGP